MNRYALCALTIFAYTSAMKIQETSLESPEKKQKYEETILHTPPDTPFKDLQNILLTEEDTAAVLLALHQDSSDQSDNHKIIRREQHKKAEAERRAQNKKDAQLLSQTIIPRMLQYLPQKTQKECIDELQKLKIPHFDVKELTVQPTIKHQTDVSIEKSTAL